MKPENYQIHILCENGRTITLVMSGFTTLRKWLAKTTIHHDNIRWHTIPRNLHTCH